MADASLSDVKLDSLCEVCQLRVPKGQKYTWTRDCYCAFPEELIDLCKRFVEIENKVPVLDTNHIKQFREHGTFPEEVAYIVNPDISDDDDSLNGLGMDPKFADQTPNPIIQTPHPGKRDNQGLLDTQEGAGDAATAIDLLNIGAGAAGGTSTNPTFNPETNPITSTGIVDKPPPFDPAGVLGLHQNLKDLNDPTILIPPKGPKLDDPKSKSHQMITRSKKKLGLDKLTDEEKSIRDAGLEKDRQVKFASELQTTLGADPIDYPDMESTQITQDISLVEKNIENMFAKAKQDLSTTHGDLIKTHQNAQNMNEKKLEMVGKKVITENEKSMIRLRDEIMADHNDKFSDFENRMERLIIQHSKTPSRLDPNSVSPTFTPGATSGDLPVGGGARKRTTTTPNPSTSVPPVQNPVTSRKTAVLPKPTLPNTNPTPSQATQNLTKTNEFLSKSQPSNQLLNTPKTHLTRPNMVWDNEKQLYKPQFFRL